MHDSGRSCPLYRRPRGRSRTTRRRTAAHLSMPGRWPGVLRAVAFSCPPARAASSRSPLRLRLRRPLAPLQSDGTVPARVKARAVHGIPCRAAGAAARSMARQSRPLLAMSLSRRCVSTSRTDRRGPGPLKWLWLRADMDTWYQITIHSELISTRARESCSCRASSLRVKLFSELQRKIYCALRA